MGWSCTKAASDTLRNFYDACRKQTGGQNTFKVGKRDYFIETDNIEHPDGSITGEIQRIATDGTSSKVDDFKIDGLSGKMMLGMKFTKEAANVESQKFLRHSAR
jgi:hypothetical protein